MARRSGGKGSKFRDGFVQLSIDFSRGKGFLPKLRWAHTCTGVRGKRSCPPPSATQNQLHSVVSARPSTLESPKGVIRRSDMCMVYPLLSSYGSGCVPPFEIKGCMPLGEFSCYGTLFSRCTSGRSKAEADIKRCRVRGPSLHYPVGFIRDVILSIKFILLRPDVSSSPFALSFFPSFCCLGLLVYARRRTRSPGVHRLAGSAHCKGPPPLAVHNANTPSHNNPMLEHVVDLLIAVADILWAML